MKTILAICLVTAGFAMIPGASATTCDPVTGDLCAGSSSYGDCASDGYAQNVVQYYSYDANGFTIVYAQTYCYNNPSWGITDSGIAVGAQTCDASWNCDFAGANWYGYSYSGYSYCDTSAYVYVDGQYQYQSLGCPAGAPPAIPAVLP